MADNEILAAINDVGKSVVAMEKQLKNCCTKEDMSKMTKEIRGEVLKNSQRIDTLFEMRKNDAPLLAKRVEMIVDRHIAKKGNGRGALSSEEPFEQDYLLSRRSVRLWPIPAGINLEEQVRQFFYTILSIPEAVSKTIGIDSVQRMVQPRRSKITGEVLVRFTSTQDRDTVQSYAPNLAGIEGKAGLRLDIPEHLRGTFRQFESLAALLRRRHGQVKRSIKFEDIGQTLCMDVKLNTTGWHRLTVDDVREALSRPGLKNLNQPEMSSKSSQDERKLILMQDQDLSSEDPIIVGSDDEERISNENE